MSNRTEIKNYFRSITHTDPRIKTCHRCGRVTNYERITTEKKYKLIKLKIPIKLLKWHKFKLCESCFEDKLNNQICRYVDLEQLEKLNLTYAYLHKQL